VLAVAGLLTALTPPAAPIRSAAAVRLQPAQPVTRGVRAAGVSVRAAGVRWPSGPGRA
jgi:hypothetical protein